MFLRRRIRLRLDPFVGFSYAEISLFFNLISSGKLENSNQQSFFYMSAQFAHI